MTKQRDAIIRSFRDQAEWCRTLDSPFTATLLDRACEDLAAGGPVADLLGDWPGEPMADALALRFAGALHARVLAGSDPSLATHYPPRSVMPDPDALWRDVTRALRDDPVYFREFLGSPPQTNEVRRAAALYAGLQVISGATGGLPVRLIEIGASAGLLQALDRFRYAWITDAGPIMRGDPASPVEIPVAWDGAPPPADAGLAIASRRACDLRPIDIGEAAARLRLGAYVWADQRDRLARLDAAIALARQVGVRVEQADAGTWVGARLEEARAGEVTVLCHSIMWHYLPAATRTRIETDFGDHGANATEDRPLAWLRLEFADPNALPVLALTLWNAGPGSGETRVLARVHPHGASIEWLGA